jgi:hypothetical protein
MIFLCIFRRICSEGVFPYHAFNSLFITGEFTVGKKADDYYDKKNDDEVFHNLWFPEVFLPSGGEKSGRGSLKKIFDNFCELCWFVQITWMTGTLNDAYFRVLHVSFKDF